jgi:putative membrane protein
MACAVIAWVASLSIWAQPALAHSENSGPLTPNDLWHHWNTDLWLIGTLVLTHWLYGRGVSRLWARAGVGRGISILRVVAFAAGELALVVALVSPLDALAETLLSAHMVQHGLLIAIAPPLLLLGLPGAAFAWALPSGMGRRLTGSAPFRATVRSLSWMLHPLAAAAIHGAAIWIWHAPAIFDAALASTALHVFEHFTFLATALLFWQSLLLAQRSIATAVLGGAGAFATLLHGGLLGALITFAPHVLFSWYVGRTSSWGLEPIEDQQLAGLIMGVPLGIVYFAASLVLAARLVSASVNARSQGTAITTRRWWPVEPGAPSSSGR